METLWREFGELKNAVVVGRVSWAGADANGVERTFRLLDGTYIRIESTASGNRLVPVPEDEAEVYEDAWQELGTRAIASGPRSETPHGILWASDEFDEMTETNEVIEARMLARLGGD